MTPTGRTLAFLVYIYSLSLPYCLKHALTIQLTICCVRIKSASSSFKFRFLGHVIYSWAGLHSEVDPFEYANYTWAQCRLAPKLIAYSNRSTLTKKIELDSFDDVLYGAPNGMTSVAISAILSELDHLQTLCSCNAIMSLMLAQFACMTSFIINCVSNLSGND